MTKTSEAKSAPGVAVTTSFKVDSALSNKDVTLVLVSSAKVFCPYNQN